MTEPTFKDWKENNLCGVCPYRKEVQDRNARLEAELKELHKDYSVLLGQLVEAMNERGVIEDDFDSD